MAQKVEATGSKSVSCEFESHCRNEAVWGNRLEQNPDPSGFTALAQRQSSRLLSGEFQVRILGAVQSTSYSHVTNLLRSYETSFLRDSLKPPTEVKI